MLAADTNLLVRFLLEDDPDQSAKAKALIGGADIFVPTTVLLEAEWVLRRLYKCTPDQCRRALSAFAGLPRVTLENPTAAALAFDWMAQGLDFADALHLAASPSCEALVTFDLDFIKMAKRAPGAIEVRQL